MTWICQLEFYSGSSEEPTITVFEQLVDGAENLNTGKVVAIQAHLNSRDSDHDTSKSSDTPNTAFGSALVDAKNCADRHATSGIEEDNLPSTATTNTILFSSETSLVG